MSHLEGIAFESDEQQLRERTKDVGRRIGAVRKNGS
jgi:hypothetical protein